MSDLIKRLEKDKWHVSGVDIQEAINLIESRAAEIAAHKRDKDLLADEIGELRLILATDTGTESKIAELQKLCDQLGEALQIEYKRNIDNYHGASTKAKEALTAWSNSK